MTESFTAGETARLAGVCFRTFKSWIDRGQAAVVGRDRRRGGWWLRFSRADVLALAAQGHLSRAGVPMPIAKQAVHHHLDAIGSASARYLVITYFADGSRSTRTARRLREITSASPNQKLTTVTIIADLANITSEVSARLQHSS
jgi:hypothetical protein